MRCLPTLLVALFSAVFAAVLGGLIAEVGSRAHDVSNMEGGRGWLVLICIVLSFVAGGILGAIATLLAGKLKNSVLVAFGADAGAAMIAAALVFLTVDWPPTIDGRKLALEMEVMLPAGQTTLPEASRNELKVTTTGIRDQYYPTMELAKAMLREGRLVVPGSVPLASESDRREVTVQLGAEGQQQFALKLPPAPTKQDETWSEWITPSYESAQKPVAKDREVAVRYRIQPR